MQQHGRQHRRSPIRRGAVERRHGSFICAKVRVAGGAVVFALIALVLFVTTPLGAGLPHAVGSFFSTVGHATDLVLRGAG
jgi:hypothetical protein